MPVYRIADLNIYIEPKYGVARRHLAPYRVESGQSDRRDAEIVITPEDFADRRGISGDCSEQSAEDLLILFKFCNLLVDEFEGFFFHSSVLELDGYAYVFTAPSGTGKSTHTALWRKRFGDRVTMINDDKPVIRKIGSAFYACGTPWMGKANIGTNTKAPVKAVYILQRSEKNRAVRVSPSQVAGRLFEATAIEFERKRTEKLLELYDEFFSVTPLFVLNCNTDESAADAAYRAANKADGENLSEV